MAQKVIKGLIIYRATIYPWTTYNVFTAEEFTL